MSFFFLSKVKIQFIKNKAVLGSAVYMSRLDTCSWYSGRPLLFKDTFIVDWPIWKIEYICVHSVCGILKSLIIHFQGHICMIRYHLCLVCLFIILTLSIPSFSPKY